MRFGDWESGGQIKRALRNNMDGPRFPMNCKRIIHVVAALPLRRDGSAIRFACKFVGHYAASSKTHSHLFYGLWRRNAVTSTFAGAPDCSLIPCRVDRQLACGLPRSDGGPILKRVEMLYLRFRKDRIGQQSGSRLL